MIRNLFSLLTVLSLASCSGRTSFNLNQGWQFSLEGEDSTYIVDVPHDWAFERGYSPEGAQGEQGGYMCGGVGDYVRTFSLRKSDMAGKRVYVDFDGVYMNSTVTLNGMKVGFRPYGYISFSYDVTPYVKTGLNLLEVHVDNSMEPSARWYHGCGIYGNVGLRIENPLHFIKDGIFVRSQNVGGKVEVSFEKTLPDSYVKASFSLDGSPVGETVVCDDSSFVFDIPSPELWSPEHPVLYTMHISLYDNSGCMCDAESVKFGLKDIRWSPDSGMFLNGVQYKINGVCEHLEGGPVGAAWTKDLLSWKLRLLKDMGCNSIRTAHNPQLPFFYDLCDSLGFLVMDEVFDGWKKKAPQDYGKQAFEQWWGQDLKDFVRRDRNHACVYIYSVGNETKGSFGPQLVKVCHKMDPTRCVTSGHSGSEHMDILGVNGHSERGYFIRDYVPGTQAFIGTETPHTWQVRGFYRTQTWYRDGFPNKGQDPYVIPSLCEKEVFGYDWTASSGRSSVKQVFNSSYDNATVRLTARHNIALCRDLPWYSGYYRWSGFDYLGEAGFVHGGWPFRAFQGGALDLAGFPKDLYYLYQSQWNPSVDMVHLLPSWTHPDVEPGTLIPVWAYTTGDEAELFAFSKSLGRVKKGKDWDNMMCQWMVPWNPGCLSCVAYRNGEPVDTAVICTAAEPSRFIMCGERVGSDISIVTFKQVDSVATMCPYGDSRVWISLPEGARVLSFENGSPVDDENNFGALSRRCFFGLSRAFIKTSSFDKRGLPSGLVAGMICCDRSMKTSSRAFIHVMGLKNYSVHYTIDGSEPSLDSPLYDGPFGVSEGLVIRARAFRGRKVVLDMSETISGGLYWGRPGESVMPVSSIDFDSGGTYSWYQENDGGERDAALRIVYSCGKPCRMELSNNGKVVSTVELPSGASVSKSIMMGLQSGANALRLRLLPGSPVPSIERIDVL